MNRKTLGIILVGLAFIMGGWLMYGPSGSEKPVPEEKEYRNPGLGLFLKYPKSWEVDVRYPFANGIGTGYGGEGGHFAVDIISASTTPLLDLAESIAKDPRAPFGEKVNFEPMSIEGEKGILMLPDLTSDSSTEAGYLITYPKPLKWEGEEYHYLLLLASPNKLVEIARSIEFIQ